MNYVEVKIGSPIDYIHHTKECGRAEFAFCPVFKQGELKEVYITPLQQPDLKHGFVVKIETKSIKGFCVSDSSQGYRIFDNAYCWFGGWCDEHKTYYMRWYVPASECRLWPVMYSDALVLEFWPKDVDPTQS